MGTRPEVETTVTRKGGRPKGPNKKIVSANVDVEIVTSLKNRLRVDSQKFSHLVENLLRAELDRLRSSDATASGDRVSEISLLVDEISKKDIILVDREFDFINNYINFAYHYLRYFRADFAKYSRLRTNGVGFIEAHEEAKTAYSKSINEIEKALKSVCGFDDAHLKDFTQLAEVREDLKSSEGVQEIEKHAMSMVERVDREIDRKDHDKYIAGMPFYARIFYCGMVSNKVVSQRLNSFFISVNIVMFLFVINLIYTAHVNGKIDIWTKVPFSLFK